MLLSKETTIYTLTKDYPFLVDALADHNRLFDKLRNPILRQTMGRIATIEKAASMGNERVLDLMLFIAGTIMATTVRILDENGQRSGGKMAIIPMGKRPAFRLECGRHSGENGQYKLRV